jgi:hypothetical protein
LTGQVPPRTIVFIIVVNSSYNSRSRCRTDVSRPVAGRETSDLQSFRNST